MGKTQYEIMTETPVHKLIIKLSVPTIISMLITNIYNLVDTAFVGTLGNSASGAVGVVFGFMSILQAIGFLFGQGSGSIISRSLGQRDTEKASKTASMGFFYAFFLAVVTEIVCLLMIHPLVMALGSTETIAPFAEKYIICILFAAPFMVSSFTLNNILRYEGKAALGMIGLSVGAILNICGDAVLMFGFKMGILGAGISTAVSQFVSFVILISMFIRGKTQCKLSIKLCGFNMKQLLDIASTGFPSLLRQGLSSLTTVLLNQEAALYGDVAVAAMSIVSRIMFFTFSIAIGIGQGFQPVSGFNYGAGRYDRLLKGYRFSIVMAELIVVVMAVILFIAPERLIQIFRNNATVMEIGGRALRLQSLAQLLLPFCMVTEMLLQSTGKKIGATFLSAVRNGILFIPCLYVLSRTRGLAGIQEAQPLSVVLGVIPAVICALYFFRIMPKTNDMDQKQTDITN